MGLEYVLSELFLTDIHWGQNQRIGPEVKFSRIIKTVGSYIFITNIYVRDEYIRTQLFSDSLYTGSPLPCQVRQLGLHHPAEYEVL